MDNKKIRIYDNNRNSSISLKSAFVDDYMKDANEAQLKVYLYLLRSMGSGRDTSITSMADAFNFSERDIIRALEYWNGLGLITLRYEENGELSEISFSGDEDPRPCVSAGAEPDGKSGGGKTSSHKPADAIRENREDQADQEDRQDFSAPPARKTAEEPVVFYPRSQLSDFSNQEDVKDLIFMTEQYIGHPLNSPDLTSIIFIYDKLSFTVELIEYLIGYCVENGHTSMRYIQKVAIDWKEKGIDSVSAARTEVKTLRKDYYSILRAFGISGRDPVRNEQESIRRWIKEYGFSLDIILEAVDRTMRQASKPSFEYCESILRSWYNKGIRHKKDIVKADRDHSLNRSGRNPAARSDRFHNFTERRYDYEELENKLLKN